MFNSVQYDFNNDNLVHHNDALSLTTDESISLGNSSYKKSAKNTSTNKTKLKETEEASPLLTGNKKENSDKLASISSPPLEVKLGSKLGFSKNYIERYLPRHQDEDEVKSGRAKNSNENKSNKTGEKDQQFNSKSTKQQQSTSPSNKTFLTFVRHSTSLSPNETITNNNNGHNSHSSGINGDNFSLLTPSSSCSTTPIGALMASVSDTIDQCSSSMSSSSNNDLKISPINNLFNNNIDNGHNKNGLIQSKWNDINDQQRMNKSDKSSSNKNVLSSFHYPANGNDIGANDHRSISSINSMVTDKIDVTNPGNNINGNVNDNDNDYVLIKKFSDINKNSHNTIGSLKSANENQSINHENNNNFINNDTNIGKENLPINNGKMMANLPSTSNDNICNDNNKIGNQNGNVKNPNITANVNLTFV